jgi:5-methyltetrahydrofolate corrinoid/iron sulfur protein methyltransferase
LSGRGGGDKLLAMIIAADNLSAARPSVRRAIEQRDTQAIAQVCQKAAAAGAQWLDLNPGFVPPKQRAEVWRFLVQSAEAACSLKLMLDTPQVDSLALALQYCTRPPVLNMATAQEGRLAPVLDLAQAHGLEVVAATMTHTVPVSHDERLALAALIVEQAARRGIVGPRLYLDPMVLPLAVGGGEVQAREVLATLRAIPCLFEPAPRTLIAISNLTTATATARAQFAGPPFLAAACGAGLDVAMLDVEQPALMQTARLCQVFAGERLFAPAEHQA